MKDIRSWVKESRIDIVALDRDGNPVLLVEVKGARELSESKRHAILSDLNNLARSFSVPYIMFADLNNIDVYSPKETLDPNREWFNSPLMKASTSMVLPEYDPEFSKKSTEKGRIFSHYLERLIEGWLRDIAYHWKSDTPPFSSKLKEIGLAEKLSDGTTFSESSISR